jgi:bifunctional DNA-binding transcriptional regulator/antitoxin component of YhaV-PrlF toxin-antitoxin module
MEGAMTVAKVQARGQVTVPQDIREACGVMPGSELLFIKTGPERFECRVLPKRRSLREVAAQYTVAGVAPDLDQLREEMADELVREMGLAEHES